MHHRPTQAHIQDVQHALSASADGDANPTLTAAEALFKRRIVAQKTITVEHDLAVVDVGAGAIGPARLVGAELL